MGSRRIHPPLIVLAVCLLLCACGGTREEPGPGPKTQSFHLRSLAKTDIGQVLEVHVREIRADLRLLMEKLYRRNPRELHKSGGDIQTQLDRLFTRTDDWHFAEFGDRTGTDLIHASLAPDFTGDRVFAYVAGLTSMIMGAYEFRKEFYALESVDPQNLYNSARNIEIAAWKLAHDRDENGEPYLYSNSLSGEALNLSYERLFGKMISLQDTMAVIIAGRTNRTITTVIQKMATAMFLPVL